eukprot:9504699-Lingulodinium_polyedra.AAC.1
MQPRSQKRFRPARRPRPLPSPTEGAGVSRAVFRRSGRRRAIGRRANRSFKTLNESAGAAEGSPAPA